MLLSDSGTKIVGFLDTTAASFLASMTTSETSPLAKIPSSTLNAGDPMSYPWYRVLMNHFGENRNDDEDRTNPLV